MKKLLPSICLLLASGLGSCASSSTSFIEKMPNYSVIRGRIMSVENLNADLLETLGDGVAVTLSQPGCKILISFGNDRTTTLDVPVGAIVVYGSARDYVLQVAPGAPR